MNRSSLILFVTLFFTIKSSNAFAQNDVHPNFTEPSDEIIWSRAIQFAALFNSGDSTAMKQFLPDDFMLQWMHENFLGKKMLLSAMRNDETHKTLQHQLSYDAGTIVTYADAKNAACLNTSFCFVDPSICESLSKNNRFGLCIMYFQLVDKIWVLKTVHFDLHCSLCN